MAEPVKEPEPMAEPAAGGSDSDATKPATDETAIVPPAQPPKTEAPKIEEPKRSDDVTKWKGDDFTAAKAANDSRLPNAIEHVGNKFPTSEAAARALVSLLKTEELPIPGRSDGKTQPVQVNTAVATAILEALSKSKTNVAADTFRQLLGAKLQILFVDRQLSNNVLPLIAKRGYAAFDDLLFEIVSTPQKFRNKAQSRTDGAYTAEKIREDAIYAISSDGSPALRERLAVFASDRAISAETAQTIESAIARDDLRNRLAQVTMLRNEHISKRTRQALEAAVATNSSRAVELLLGIPEKLHEPPAPGTVSRQSEKPREEADDRRAEYLELARKLWTPDMDTYLDERLQKGGGLSELADVVFMIGTMPLASTRFTTSELLAIHGHRGTQAWASAGMLGRATTDPAFVVLAKNVYHDRASGRTTKVVRPEEGRPRIDDSGKKDWASNTGELVDSWMRRLYSAHREKVASTGKFTPDESALPIKLHKDATIVAQCTVKWPDDVKGELPGVEVAPLQLRYVRLENETYMDRVQHHYQRFAGKTKRGKTHDIKAGQWLDSLTTGSAPNSLLSIDIRIRSAGKQGGAIPNAANPKKDEIEWVVVEILTIEIPEPKNPDPRRKVE